MVRSKSIKRNEMRGDNAAISPPYYFRQSTREPAKPLVHKNIRKQNVSAEPSVKIMDNWSNGKCKYCSYCLTGMLGVSFCIILVSTLFPYPLYASCTVKWKFDETCAPIVEMFQWYMTLLSSWNVCRQQSDYCIYMLEGLAEENIITAIHSAFKSKMYEKIKIVFEEVNNTCLATANSVSNKWFMIFDYGINYCNLHKLLVETGRHRYTKEQTSDAICTQYNMAVCG